MRIQVKDFMSSPVITSTGDTTVGKARDLMERKGLRALPVVDYEKKLPNIGTKLRGIVTDTDLNGAEDEKLLEDIMTPKLHVIHKDSNAKSAASMMLKHKVRHLVAMEDGEIIGMISVMDIVKLVANYNLE